LTTKEKLAKLMINNYKEGETSDERQRKRSQAVLGAEDQRVLGAYEAELRRPHQRGGPTSGEN
jgi:hypothetical protein